MLKDEEVSRKIRHAYTVEVYGNVAYFVSIFSITSLLNRFSFLSQACVAAVKYLVSVSLWLGVCAIQRRKLLRI